jgi:hypothetical protein
MAGRRGDLIEPGAPGDWISEGPVLDQMSAELVAIPARWYAHIANSHKISANHVLE